MKNKKHLLTKMLVFACACLFATGVSACGGSGSSDSGGSTSINDSGNAQRFEAIGDYYCEVGTEEYTLTVTDTTITWTIAGTTMTGTYTFDGTTLKVVYDNLTYENIAFANGALTVTYAGNTYKFIKATVFTVKYVTDGGSEIADAKVKNGKLLAEPEKPVKEGYIFVGWYEDETYKPQTQFNFNRPVTSDKTLYACFVENTVGKTEFEVNFELGYEGAETLPARTTIGGKLYGLPFPEREGYEFLGWWISDYNDGGKLSRQYDGQELGEPITLYAVWGGDAPAVSVEANKISWTSMGINRSYSVTVKDSEGKEVQGGSWNGSSTSYEGCDFSALPMGDYTVTVTCAGKTTTAYYRNKALAKVTVFEAEGFILKFNEVANAEKYLISVDSGSDDITDKELTTTAFDFSNYDMQEGGIKFVVKAVAEGYITSVSEEFVLERNLAAVADLTVNVDTEQATWSAVENAVSYIVTVGDGAPVEVKETSFDLKEYAGTITLKVYPVAKGYNSSAAAEYTYNKARLASPSGLHVNGATVSWNAVDGATEYLIKIGDNEAKTVTGNEYVSTDADVVSGQTCTIIVQAIGATEAQNSLWSNPLNVKVGEMDDELVYKAGAVSWMPSFGTVKYGVRVNGGEETFAEGSASCAIALTKEGGNVIEVRAYGVNGSVSEWVSVTVDAKAVVFEACGGAEAETVYKAVGDTLTLPETDYPGYDFVGWYDAEGGASAGGKKYQDGTFENNESLTLYAVWTPKEYTVSFASDEYTAEEVPSQTVLFKEAYTLSVPKTESETKAFVGWYSEPNGAGIRYTNHTGASLEAWKSYKNETLYAFWMDIFTFESVDEGNGYAVLKGAGISYVTEITVPREYNGKPVTVLEANAFLNCSNLVTINFYDTVQTVELGDTSAFTGCTNLMNVNVIHVEGNTQALYESSGGVLLYNNSVTGKELKYFPAARTGAYSIPEGVQVLPVNVFKSAKITEVTIPASVRTIQENAFYQAKLTSVVFLPAAEGEAEVPLTIGTKAFYYASITEITLPARLTSLDLSAKGNSFYACNYLMSIKVEGNGAADTEGNTKVYYSGVEGYLCDAAGTTLVYAPLGLEGEIRIPLQITAIGESAFSDGASATKITKVIFHSAIKEIGVSAFDHNTGITELVFEGEKGNTDLTIRSSAFYYCTGLTSVTLPANLRVLEKNAFGSASKLTVVYADCWGDETRTLDFATGAFANTSGTMYVQELHLGAEFPALDNLTGVFGSAKLATIVVAEGNPYYASEDNVLYNSDMTAILFYPLEKAGEFVVKDGVKIISDSVFIGRKGLTKITIPATVTYIGEQAFKDCTYLVEVVFIEPTAEQTDCTIEIGASAFRACSKLASINLPSYLTKVSEYTFYSCYALKNLVIPDNVTEIGDFAFYACDGLVTLTLPAKLEILGASSISEDGTVNITSFNVFRNSDSLEALVISEENPYYMTVDGILYSKKDGEADILYYCPTLKSGDLVLPGSITRIHDYAFQNNNGVTSITFGERKTDAEGNPVKLEIGDYAFYFATTLTSVVLPEGLEFLGGDASVTLTSSTFYNCSSLASVTLPGTLKTLSKYSFYSCKALTEITIPKSVTLIERQAFNSCSGLKNVIFEEGGTESLVLADGTFESDNYGGEYAYGAFYGCPAIESIVLPERLIKIGACAFANMPLLTTIDIPANVTEIGLRAFWKSGLTSIHFAEGTKEVDGVEVPVSQLSVLGDYALAYTKIASIELPESLTEIKSRAFYYMPLTSIRIPASVQKIGFGSSTYTYGYVFYGTNIETITFADNSQLTEIDKYSFYYLKQLTSVDFGKNSSLTTIGESAFESDTALTFINLPATVSTIGVSAFEGCTALAAINFETNEDGTCAISSIGDYAFKKTALTSFSFPVSTIDKLVLGINLFEGCQELKNVYLSESVSSIEYVFSKCYSIEKITVSENSGNFSADPDLPLILNKDGTAIRLAYGTLPAGFTLSEGVVEIGARAFEGQENLTTITIPRQVKVIGDYAFASCENLAEVVFERGSLLSSLGQYAFQYCTALTSVELPDDLTIIEGGAFRGCTNLETVKLPANLQYLGYYTNASGTPTTSSSTSYGAVFQNCVKLKTVEIPSSVKIIYSSAFRGCTSLEAINVPNAELSTYIFADCTNLRLVSFADGLKSLGNYMFSKCTALTQVDLPSGLTFLGQYTFEYSGLTSIEIPLGITMLGNTATACTISGGSYLFRGCENLTEVKLNNVTKIGGYVFQNCTNLAELDLSKITLFGTYAFSGTALSIADLSAANAAASFGTYAFSNCANLKTVILPEDTITSLGNYMFKDCVSLDTIAVPSTVDTIGTEDFKNTLPESLTFLGRYTFQNTGIKEITIPSKITKLGHSATACSISSSNTYRVDLFRGCKNLTQVNLNNVTQIGAFVFEDTGITELDLSKVTLIGTAAFAGTPLTSVNLTSVTSMGGGTYNANPSSYYRGAFEDCIFLTDVTLNAKYTSIPSMTFKGCTALEKITIPSGVKTLGSRAFENCTKLSGIELPATVTSIGQYSFQNCTSLTSINIPKSVSTITAPAFGGCTSMTSITVDQANTNFTVVDGALIKVTSSKATIVAYPSGLVPANGTVTIPAQVTVDSNTYEVVMGGYMFVGCVGVKKIVLGEGFTSIPGYAFYGAVGLEEVVFPESLTTVGTYTFQGCTSLTSITLPDGLTKVSDYMFKDCTALESVVLPESVTEIGVGAFMNTGLKSFVVPAHIQTVGKAAFARNTQLASVEIESADTVLTAGSSATTDGSLGIFAYCEALTSVKFPAGTTAIPAYTFYGCTGLTTIEIPEGVESLGIYAFRDCTGLTSVTLPESLLTIGSSVFWGCTSLTSITLPDSVTSIGASAFRDCVSLTTVNIPASLASLSAYTFQGCTSIKALYVPATVGMVNGSVFVGWTSEQTIYFACSKTETVGWNEGWAKDCDANIVFDYVEQTA